MSRRIRVRIDGGDPVWLEYQNKKQGGPNGWPIYHAADHRCQHTFPHHPAKGEVFRTGGQVFAVYEAVS